MLTIRAGAHAVNLEYANEAVRCEQIAWLSASVSKALRAIMSERAIPAPASLYEIEACAQAYDLMCGSQVSVIESDMKNLHSLLCESIEEVLEAIVDDPDLLVLMAEFPTYDLLETQPWAA